MRNGIIAVAVAAAIIIGVAVASRKPEPASPSKALQNAATQAEQASGNLWNQAQDLVPQAAKGIADTAQQLQQFVPAIQSQAPSAAQPATPPFVQPAAPTSQEPPAGASSETSPTAPTSATQ